MPLKDNTQCWWLKKNGSYVLKNRDKTSSSYSVQQELQHSVEILAIILLSDTV